MKGRCKRFLGVAPMDLAPVIVLLVVMGMMTIPMFPSGPGAPGRDEGASQYTISLEPVGKGDLYGVCREEILLQRAGDFRRYQLTDDPNMRYYSASISDDGCRVAFCGGQELSGYQGVYDQGIYLGEVVWEHDRPVRLDRVRLVLPIVCRYAVLVFPDWASDGRMLTYSLRSMDDNGRQQSDVFVLDTYTGKVRNLTRTARINESSPSFRPGSDEIVYLRLTSDRRKDLYTVKARGSFHHRLTSPVNSPYTDHIQPRWSSDGHYVLFYGDQRWYSRIPADGSSPPTSVPWDYPREGGGR